MSDLAETADVVVVGDGSAGAVLAARLSQDTARTVLLLEAGRAYAYLRRDLAVSCRDHIEATRNSPTASGRPSSAPRARR